MENKIRAYELVLSEEISRLYKLLAVKEKNLNEALKDINSINNKTLSAYHKILAEYQEVSTKIDVLEDTLDSFSSIFERGVE